MFEKIHAKVVEITIEKYVKTSVKEGLCIKNFGPKTLLQCFASEHKCLRSGPTGCLIVKYIK